MTLIALEKLFLNNQLACPGQTAQAVFG